MITELNSLFYVKFLKSKVFLYRNRNCVGFRRVAGVLFSVVKNVIIIRAASVMKLRASNENEVYHHHSRCNIYNAVINYGSSFDKFHTHDYSYD